MRHRWALFAAHRLGGCLGWSGMGDGPPAVDGSVSSGRLIRSRPRGQTAAALARLSSALASPIFPPVCCGRSELTRVKVAPAAPAVIGSAGLLLRRSEFVIQTVQTACERGER